MKMKPQRSSQLNLYHTTFQLGSYRCDWPSARHMDIITSQRNLDILTYNVVFYLFTLLWIPDRHLYLYVMEGSIDSTEGYCLYFIHNCFHENYIEISHCLFGNF